MRLEDFTGAWRYLPQLKGAIFLLLVVVLLVPLLFALSGGFSTERGTLTVVTMLICLSALFFGLWRGRKRWARSALEGLRGEEGISFRFDDGGFAVKAPGRESRVAWSELYRCIETASAFLVYTGPQAVVVVPKRAFADADATRLQALLAARVRPRPLGGTVRPARLLVTWLVLVIAFLVIWQLLSQR